MLPFLKKKQDTATPGVMIKTRTPDESNASEDQDDPSAAHEACGQAIIDAIKSGNASAVAAAMQDMYEMCQSGGSEDSQANPHSYDSQNQLAAKGNE